MTRLRVTILVLLLASLGCLSPTGASTDSQFRRYANESWDISFDYPATMVPQEKVDNRYDGDAPLSSITLQLTDRREVTIIFVQIVDDPILAASPGWYPPPHLQLKIFAAGDLGILTIANTPDNDNAVRAALDAASYKAIEGEPAIEYRVFLNDSEYGYVYVRGATIVTRTRSYTLMAVGGLSAESPIHEPVKPERVDEIWSRLLDTLSIDS